MRSVWSIGLHRVFFSLLVRYRMWDREPRLYNTPICFDYVCAFNPITNIKCTPSMQHTNHHPFRSNILAIIYNMHLCTHMPRRHRTQPSYRKRARARPALGRSPGHCSRNFCCCMCAHVCGLFFLPQLLYHNHTHTHTPGI